MEIVLARKEVITDKTLCRVFGILAFAVLMSLGAFVRIPLPFSPVPITLQTFFVLLSGACLAGRLGGVSQLAYLVLGAAGLPVFTGAGSGLLYLSGPTGGYMLGFVFAALFIGKFIKHIPNKLYYIFAFFCLADFILLSFGALWLKTITGFSFTKSALIGFLPFVPGDLLKAFAAAWIYSGLRKRCEEVF